MPLSSHPSVHSFIQQDLPQSTQYQALFRFWGQGYQAQVCPQHLPPSRLEERRELGKRVYPQHLPNPGWRRKESWVKGYVEVLQGWMVRCLLIKKRETDQIFFFFPAMLGLQPMPCVLSTYIPHPQGLISSYIVLSGGFFLFFFLKPRARFIFRTKVCRQCP